MTASALNAGATRLVSHVPGAATTRGGANHAKQQQPHHPFGAEQHGPGGATALNAAGHAGARGSLPPVNTTHQPHHNPPTHARCRLAHHSILLPPAARRHVAHFDAAPSPRASVSSAAAAAASAASAKPQDRGRRTVVTRAFSANGAKKVDDDATEYAESRAREARDSNGFLDRRARSSEKLESVSFSFASADAEASYDEGLYDDDISEFADARIPTWVTLTRRRWSQVTMSAASAATVPFLFLTMPQIVKNASLIAAGRPEALAAIAWQGQVAGLLGNLLLLSYFTDKGELSASVVQGVGVCATAALLTQICAAGHIPVPPFLAAAAAVVAGVAVSLARLLGKCGPVDENGVPCVGNVQCDLSKPFGSFDDVDELYNDLDADNSSTKFFAKAKIAFGDFSNTLWSFYQGVLGVVGLAALPQVGLQSLLPAEAASRLGVLPGLVGGSLGLGLVVLGKLNLLPPALATAWGRLSGWTATLLFMTMPVAQLAANFSRPATLAGLSVWSSLLAMLGNALMVPRALYTRDVIWLTGSTWGCTLAGWGVMLSLFLGTDLNTGARYIDGFAFGALTATFFLYLAAVWLVDGVSALAAGYHAGWRLKAWNFHGAAGEQPRTEIKRRREEEARDKRRDKIE
jgi:hypothetical protein